MTKGVILSEFFKLKGNYQIEQIYAYKNKYIENPDLEVWSDTKVAATLKIADVWIIEAEENDSEKARAIANSVVEELRDISWDLDCIDLFSCVVDFADDYQSLFIKAVNALLDYREDKNNEDHKRCDNIEMNSNVDLTQRITRDIL